MRYSTGDVYEGEWRNDVFEGSGSAQYAKGHVYKGDFSTGVKHGHGKMVYPNGVANHTASPVSCLRGGAISSSPIIHAGDMYEGTWHDGKKHDLGRMEYHNGDTYEGQVRTTRAPSHTEVATCCMLTCCFAPAVGRRQEERERRLHTSRRDSRGR